MAINKWLKADIEAVVREFIACCCVGGGVTISDSAPTDPPGDSGPFMHFNTSNNTLYLYYNDTWNVFSGGGSSFFGITTDNPPVAAPGVGDPVVLMNLTTGVLYYWNAGWLVGNAGGTDTNIANTDLVFLANRLITLGAFSLQFDGNGAGTGYGFNAFDTANSRTSSLTVLPTSIAMQVIEALNEGKITVSPFSVKFNSTLGVYELDTAPVTDETPSVVLGYNSITKRIVGMTKYTVSDTAYGVSWNGVTGVAPSKNAVYDEMELRALDSAVVHDTGNESIDGVKTFTSDPIIPDEAYGAPWNGSLEPPTKNALYDKIETLAEITDLDNLKLDQFGITIDGGGAVFATGTKGYIRIPYSGTITGWTIIEISGTPLTCSIVVDIWKDTYANYPPTVADTVFTDKPTITTGIKGQNNAPAIVAGKEVVTAGDMFGYNVDSVTDAFKVAVLIHITKN